MIHKNMSAEAQAAQVKEVKTRGLKVAAGVGITTDSLERAALLVEAGVDAIVLDSAHGHSKGVISALEAIKKAFPGVDIVVGNIATAQAARDLVAAGADALAYSAADAPFGVGHIFPGAVRIDVLRTAAINIRRIREFYLFVCIIF